ERIRATVGADDPGDLAVVLVGRGSSDPDANADLYKVGRLLQDSRGLGSVEPAFVSLAPPSVPEALERCRRPGPTTVPVVPYFLCTGSRADATHGQADAGAAEPPDAPVRHGAPLGPDARLARLVLERHHEAIEGEARMNCDCCVYRVALPGYEEQVGRPTPLQAHPHSHGHDHGHPHNRGVPVPEPTGGGEHLG